VTDRLPALRRNLELMPSPVPESPGLLVRDPFRYAESVLILPPALVPCLLLFDGRHDEGDLRDVLVRMTGDVMVGDLLSHLRDTLSGGGFLENEVFDALRDERHRTFAAQAARRPRHAGSAYPEEAEDLRALLARYLAEAPAAEVPGTLIGIAAPHVSLDGGWRSYGSAYRLLDPAHADRTFVVLGTSHYGRPETFGITRKSFETPLGSAAVARDVVDRLVEAAGPAVCVEDYCHSVEHSIEFQVVFLQHLFGPGVRIVPILCGPFARATAGGWPEDAEPVGQFLAALAEVAATEGDRLLWVLGIDMAHMGRRYGDPFDAVAAEGRMAEVADEDRARCRSVIAGDAHGLWARLQQDGDPLKWCGASPLYTFLAAVKPARGTLLHYEQWAIDDRSVVSFAGLAFSR
jgi:hypothetical protein